MRGKARDNNFFFRLVSSCGIAYMWGIKSRFNFLWQKKRPSNVKIYVE